MKITAEKLTYHDLMRKACSFTLGGRISNVSAEALYRSEHSPIRTQIFWIEMEDIPTFVSVHLVRHKAGCEHFVKSNRDDRGGDGSETRNTPVMHAMLINAQGLINISRKRLCRKAHAKTVEVWQAVKEAVKYVDPDLWKYMVPECEYRNGCHEIAPCGLYQDRRILHEK